MKTERQSDWTRNLSYYLIIVACFFLSAFDLKETIPRASAWFEVNTFSLSSDVFVPYQDSAASEGTAVRVLGEHHAITEAVSFPIKNLPSGKYRVWARVNWSGECANSILFQHNDLPIQIIGGDYVFGQWHWVMGPIVSLKNQTDSIRILNYEYNSKTDVIYLTSSTGNVLLNETNAIHDSLLDNMSTNKM